VAYGVNLYFFTIFAVPIIKYKLNFVTRSATVLSEDSLPIPPHKFLYVDKPFKS